MGTRGVATAGTSLTGSLTRAARAVAGKVEQVLAKEGLTLDQWLVLDALSGKGGLAMADLADRTLATAPTLTRVVDKLVTTAQAYREVDAADRRRVLVHLSARGRATYRRVAAKVAEVEARLDVTDDVLVALRGLGD
ncbi:MarR family transcriptional regulator [Amycolatopsis sp. WAC 01416]|uniref:MarR family winged helix-turn-helix transcriptional regulator n=1 Tax=unclassified Amycolatopsis TaxID=2618356 RepID=UPI000F7A6067|nr:MULTISPECIES: MarR family transcriptional regulator [unclassified Amycolatopsis]RSM60450.1 MarR family transcriptional regulator [Amycolatopsis sp. WAC 01376]RSN22255.1 MarR family transcriptional regulator [Amycolatopsis sp. WAC 01416]